MNRQKHKGFGEITLILYGLAAVAAVGALWGLYHWIVSTNDAKWEAKIVQERLVRQGQISDLALELGKRSTKRWEENQSIMNQLYDIEKSWKEKGVINRYVPPDPKRAAACPVTIGWVRYHDERAAGMPAGTGPTPGTASTPSGIEEATALETVGDNYAFYFQCKERVRQVITTYDDVRGITNSAVQRMNKRIENIERKLK